MLTVRVNGVMQQLDKEETIWALVMAHDYDCRAVAVAINGHVVSRLNWEYLLLSDGDDVRVIRALAGG